VAAVDIGPARSGSAVDAGTSKVVVLGGFRFDARSGRSIPLVPTAQRLLAFLSGRREPTARNVAAASLWPGATEDHAAGSLRSALSRLAAPCREAISVSASSLCISDETDVDVWAGCDLARRVLAGAGSVRRSDLVPESVDLLSVDLLPGWYDDWALVAAEDWRQLRLHALEALVDLLTQELRFADAIGAALAAVRADPLRESPHAALIRVHLAEGNQTEALDHFRQYSDLLRDEMGLAPTEHLSDLVGGLHRGGG
jgi:DNA-binding SARP family transcriptional activator